MVNTMKKSEIIEKLKTVKNAQIFCHARPDGDTLSSAFSLKIAFEKMGKKAQVVCADPIPDKYILSGILGELSTFEKGYDCHIAVDVANPSLLGDQLANFLSNPNNFVIDHHISNPNFAKFNYVVDQSANAINMFEIIEGLGVEIDEKLANTLLMGISTDTGHFSNSGTTAKSFFVAEKLIGLGANPWKIYNAMYKNQSVERAKLYAHVMGNIKFFHENKVAIITTTLADLEKYGCDSSVTEGFVDFSLSIGCVEIAIAVLQKGDKCYKISFRSKDKANVNALASVFGGGGHVKASGAVINGFYEDVIDKLAFNAGNYLE